MQPDLVSMCDALIEALQAVKATQLLNAEHRAHARELERNAEHRSAA